MRIPSAIAVFTRTGHIVPQLSQSDTARYGGKACEIGMLASDARRSECIIVKTRRPGIGIGQICQDIMDRLHDPWIGVVVEYDDAAGAQHLVDMKKVDE